MAEKSGISWTDATFNCWWGCTKVGGSPACDHCYAETFARRVGFSETGSQFPIWGDDAKRRYFGDAHWSEPLKWNRKAEKDNQPMLVFCQSMADWAEGRPEQRPHLERLWALQEQTPWLIWLMLTKRPQLIKTLLPADWANFSNTSRWHGTTTETQKWLDIRWSHLRGVYSPVYWLSVEPLFERITLPKDFLDLGQRAWVIVGGESGVNARPMNPNWVRALREQCLAAGVPFHFKQWGQYVPWELCQRPTTDPGRRYVRGDGKAFQSGETAEGLDFRYCEIMQKLGPSDKAFPLIDNRQWHEFPLLARRREIPIRETHGQS